MRYKPVLALFFILLVPVALAEITIQLPEDGSYNLGDVIDASISLKEPQAKDGFFKLQISCDQRSVQYYVAPVSVEANTRTEIEAPQIKIPQGLIGQCKLQADFETSFGEKIDSMFSRQFAVSDQFTIALDKNFTVEPNHKAVITASVKKADGEMAKSGEGTVAFTEQEEPSSFKDGVLTHAIDVGNAARGFYALRINVQDEYGNSGELITQLEVVGVAQRIENRLSKQTLLPREALIITPVVLDQTDQPLNKTVQLRITQDETVYASGDVALDESFSFTIENTLKPGKYVVQSDHGELHSQDTFVIAESKEVSMLNNEHMVTVKNIGNVRYKDSVTISLRSDDKSMAITEDVDLEVNEQMNVDLSKKVSAGNYIVQLAESEKTLFIPDNRNMFVKKFDGLGSMTGMAVSKVYNSKTMIGTAVFVMILIGLAAYFGPKIYHMMHKREEESIDDIFKDLREEKGAKAEKAPKMKDKTPSSEIK